jgi:membrane protein DedA with SNARE-associated domain
VTRAQRFHPMDFVLHHGVPLVALLVFITELGVPTGIPFEVGLLLAGATAVHTLPGLAAAVAVVAVADFLGTTTLFLVSRSGGQRLLMRLLCRLGAADALDRWRGRISRSARRNVAIVVGGRLLPLARMPFTVAVGLLRLPIRQFLLGATPGAVLWAGGPLTLGYLVRDRVDAVVRPIERASHLGLLVLPVIVALVALPLIIRGLRRPHRTVADVCGPA